MICPKRYLILGLGLMLLLIAVLPAAAQDGIPGSAPVRTENPWTIPLTSEPAARPASPAVDCTTAHCVLMPLVHKPAPWIDTSFKAVSLRAFREQHEVQAEDFDPQWSGNRESCSPGDTKPEFKAAILRRINYFRGMAGVPAVITFNINYSRKDQVAALMINVNRQMVDTPPPGWKCYSAEGVEAFTSSNLQINGFGPDAIRGYMRDRGAENGSVRHRRWLLYPQTRQMGTGDVPQAGDYPYANALWVLDENLWTPRPTTRDGFVAWPPPGYVPYQVVFARWSFAYPGANFDQSTVSMTDPGGDPVPVSIALLDQQYGENTLVWIPFGLADSANWPQPAGDTVYHVTIGNVKLGETLRSFSYDVIIFDPNA